ncbi:heme-binding protein [Andreprevotia chitinilytica]|uniref:heme-binding protein n=1 Tax=Andreprevotia chitinilytica TaxID=396808 RepID=UPI000556B06C|nr:heme-binding protein [Andreprevotia chitinilytica]
MIERFRSGLSVSEEAEQLGLLSGLTGRWVGKGFNLISLPDFDRNPPSTGPGLFRLLMNATLETIEFKPIGGPVPNRGSELTHDSSKGQDDINLFGLHYLQSISDSNTGEALHLEPGFWLNVPETSVPPASASIVRQASIPHGTSILLVGKSFHSPDGKPHFAEANTAPTKVGGGQLPLDYLMPFQNMPLPEPFTDRAIVKNPNLFLEAAIAPFKKHIVETVVLEATSRPDIGVLNIPFLKNAENNNAAATNVTTTFWIETVKPPTGRPFHVLQYTQNVTLNFVGIDWPHISVGTLFLQ